MRVTNNMMADRVTYNSQLSLQRFLKMQSQASSGRRLNLPSDDPIGVLRDLNYREVLSQNAQYRKTISQAQSWVQSYDSILAELKDIVSTAKEVAISMANDTYDTTARLAAANEIKSLITQAIELANVKQEDKYVFSGFDTGVQALRQASNGVTYSGDSGIIKYQIDTSSTIDVNLTGANIFLKQTTIIGEDADLNVAVNLNTLLADLHGGNGLNLVPGTITISDQNLGIVSNIDLSAAVTVEDVITTINNQLLADGITNLTVQLGSENNNLFFKTTENGLISGQTSLDVLNGGNGVNLNDGRIRLTDGALTSIDIDLSGSTTINDIISAFNTQVAGAGINNVTMQINAAGTAFEITDTNGVPLNLSIEEFASNGELASQLGLFGNINPTLAGAPLNPIVNFKIDDVGGTTAAELGIRAEITSDYVGTDLNPTLTVDALLTSLNNGAGFESGQIRIWQGDQYRNLNLGSTSLITVQDLLDLFNNSGLAITASFNPDGQGIQILNNDPYRSLTIEDVGAGELSKQMGIFGSSDMMGSLIVLANALENDDQKGTALLLENFDDAIRHLLNSRATVGANGIRLETTDSRLFIQELTYTERLSEVEDADISRLLTELATYENNYQASLLASARIIQPSLLDFLR